MHNALAGIASGTVRFACILALTAPGSIAGIIGAGAGFPFNTPPKKDNPFVFFGTVGDRDFNWFGSSDITKSRSYQSLLAIASTNPIAAYNTRKIAQDDTKDFSPRVGFAYDLTGNGKHIARGGFGIYYGQIFENITLFMIQQTNPTVFATTLNLNGYGCPESAWKPIA